MKKITLLILLLQVTFVFSQNAPIDFEPDGFGASWTWATFEAPMGESNPTFSVVANPSVDALNGSANVAKMDISYATDAGWGSAGCESMHGSDIGTFTITEQNKIVRMMVYQEGFAAPVALKFASPTGFAFPEVVIPNSVADAWVLIEFNMSGWIGAPETPDQFIFFPSYGPRATGHVVYFDNVTFNASPPPSGEPTVSAPNPTIDASEVLSVYSESYAAENTVTNFNLNAFQGGGTISETEIAGDGNKTIKIENLSFYGAQWDAVNLSSYLYVHLDYWATTSTLFNFYLIDATAGIPGGNIAEPRYSISTSGGDETLVQGEWKSVFIPLQHFIDYPSTGFDYDLNDIFQWKFDGNGTVFIDNVYFTSNGNVSTNDIILESVGALVYPNPTQNSWTLETKNVGMSSIQVFDMAGKNVLSILPDNSNIAKIDASNLDAGLYFAQVKTPQGVFSMKLIKE
ncbi:MAG: T9SS type A sorting domain-containing protein [Chitinophagales bacterium]